MDTDPAMCIIHISCSILFFYMFNINNMSVRISRNRPKTDHGISLDIFTVIIVIKLH